MNLSIDPNPPLLPFIMAAHEVKQAIAQAHFEAYAKAITLGRTPTQAMQIADAAAATKRLDFTIGSFTQGQS